jgi:hypothetical protein
VNRLHTGKHKHEIGHRIWWTRWTGAAITCRISEKRENASHRGVHFTPSLENAFQRHTWQISSHVHENIGDQVEIPCDKFFSIGNDLLSFLCGKSYSFGIDFYNELFEARWIGEL